MELRNALEAAPDLEIVWVMPENQINERSRCFIDDYGLRTRIRFLADLGSEVITRLGILNESPDRNEKGVPHPATLLLDREGVVRFVDVRVDYHVWLAPSRLERELALLP